MSNADHILAIFNTTSFFFNAEALKSVYYWQGAAINGSNQDSGRRRDYCLVVH
jgi:hypothetical protein